MKDFVFKASATLLLTVRAEDEEAARVCVMDNLQDVDTHFIRSGYFEYQNVEAEIHIENIGARPHD